VLTGKRNEKAIEEYKSAYKFLYGEII